MKKILFLILTSILLFGENTDSNSTKRLVRKYIFSRVNYILPDFLELQPKENFFNAYVSYDTLSKKVSSSVSVNIYIPKLTKKFSKTKTKKKKNKITKTQLYLKILPLIRFYRSTPTLVIKTNAFFSKKTQILNIPSKDFSLEETIYFYPFYKFFLEETTFKLHKFLNFENMVFSLSKSIDTRTPRVVSYSAGIYLYNGMFTKFIRVYGLTLSGETDEKPVVYSYKLFFNYRRVLFDKKFVFVNVEPYVLFSKDYGYEPKLAAVISINVKF
jgi:hypothetical protein